MSKLEHSPFSENVFSDPFHTQPIIFGFSFDVFVFLSDSNCSPNTFNLNFCVSGVCKIKNRHRDQ